MHSIYKNKIGTRENYLECGKIAQFSKRKEPRTTYPQYESNYV